MSELISIIVPIYNSEKYLHKCIDSILAQSYRNLEIVLVDDGSTDNSGLICDEYKKNSPDDLSIIVKHTENGGLSAARNLGLDIASGEYIVFIDSDDYILENTIEILYRNMLEYDADISVCGIQRVNEDETVTFEEKTEIGVFDTPLHYMSSVTWLHAVVVMNKLFKKKCWETLRFPLNKIHEDEFTIHLAIDNADRLVVTNEVIYAYVQHSGSIMKTESPLSYYNGYEGVLSRIEYLDKKNMIEDRDYWIRKIDFLLNYYMNNCSSMPDSAFWTAVFNQRLLRLKRIYN